MPATETAQARTWPGVRPASANMARAAIRQRFKMIGAAAAAAKRRIEFKTPANNETRLMKRR